MLSKQLLLREHITQSSTYIITDDLVYIVIGVTHIFCTSWPTCQTYLRAFCSVSDEAVVVVLGMENSSLPSIPPVR